jgi:SNF2 family DNA or RNA helicase
MPAHAVVLTTYALARRDAAALGSIEWSHAVLDEAQNIKNPRAQQARAVRTLRAGHRIALTGTPIENRLAELWSIFEFLNPGLLGSLEQFRRQLAIPVERYRNPDAMARLRRLTGPFLLRRLKSDPSIIRDLPAKLEMTVHCTLTREQAALYQAALDEMMTRIEESRGMSRRGLILKLITELKQICNHPVHFQREPGPLPTRSGKLDRLLEMLDEARSEGDGSLVYSQYKEMGDLLVQAVQAHLDVDVPFLHGGVPPRRRDQLVDRFQEEGDEAPPVFVLSLKAGGTGLNLTAANRVFHFDRWWNPAVEDQATDRAHRIGQTRTVQVHKMVTIGTLEERIDRMLIEKRELAEQVVGAGETWLTEMSDDELRELLALGGDAVVEEAGGGA